MPNPEGTQPASPEMALREALGLFSEPPIETLSSILAPFAGEGIEQLDDSWLTDLKKGFSEASWRGFTLELALLTPDTVAAINMSLAGDVESDGASIDMGDIWQRINNQAEPEIHWTAEEVTVLALDFCLAQLKMQGEKQTDVFPLSHQRLSALTASLLQKESGPGVTKSKLILPFKELAVFSLDWLKALILVKGVNYSWDGCLLVEALAVDDDHLVRAAQSEILHRFHVAGIERKGERFDRLIPILEATQYGWKFNPARLREAMVEFITDKENLSVIKDFLDLIRDIELIKRLQGVIRSWEVEGIEDEFLFAEALRQLKKATWAVESGSEHN